MELQDFVKQFVCPNTIIRLWKPINRGHQMLYHESMDREYRNDCVCMEWQLFPNHTNKLAWQSKFNRCKVIGVISIVTDTNMDAVNIVIDC